jgi:hypothetical protein
MAETETKTSTLGNVGKIADGFAAKNERNELIDVDRLRSERLSHRRRPKGADPLIGN